ncbi:uncharacterized protein LOC118623906 [Molossus molossus]|uniref:uncharacterized protein LOC118623906 n=1 Tax=Molossus molossus TaxID=27622 RepID=UPI0017461EC9|nr:uncharacterized protein LOC118623906 [Molossus molossus]
MGCCFSKELGGDNDNEKIGLLQKSVEEKEPEDKISKTLSVLLDRLEGEELHNVEYGASRAAARTDMWPKMFVRSGHKWAHRPRQSFNSISSLMCKFLARYENLDETDKNSDTAAVEQACESVCETVCVDIDSTQGFSAGVGSEEVECFSHVPGPSDQGMQEGAFVNNRLYCHPVTYKNSVVEKEIAVNVPISCNENNALGVFGREMEGTNLICVDYKRCWNSRESKFYSICVVDPGGLDDNNEPCASVRRCGAAATEESCSAVISEGVCRGAWPPDNIAQGLGHLEAPQEELSPNGLLGPNEVKEVSNEKTKPNFEVLTDSDPSCKGNTGDMEAVSLRANNYTRFPKDYTEGGILHNVGRIPESNANVDANSLEYICANSNEGESHSSALVSLMGDSPVNLINDTSNIEQNGESGAVKANVDQSLNSEKEGGKNFINSLKDNDCSSLDVNRSDNPKRCIISVNFGNECLPFHANFREATPSRSDDPRPEYLGPVVTEGQYNGDHSLGTRTTQLVSKRELTLQPESSSSYQDEDERSIFEDESHGKRAFERRSLSQEDLCADIEASIAQAQICDLTRAVQAANVEVLCQRTDTLNVRSSQKVSPNVEFPVGLRCVQSNFMSSAFIFACTEEESETGQCHKTEDELCVKSSGSGSHRLENAEEQSLKANHRETSKKEVENVKFDTKAVCHWETNTVKCKAVPGQDVLACVSSNIAKTPDFKTNQIEKHDETCRVNDCRHEDLQLVPPVSSGAQMAEEEETYSFNCGGDPGLEQVSCTSAGAVAGHKPELIGEEMEEGLYWDKDNSDFSSGYCRGPCGTSRLAHHFTQRNATATVKGLMLNGKEGFVGSSAVNFGEMELGHTLAGYSCLAGVDPAQVDRHTAVPHGVLQAITVIPGGSKEIVVSSSEEHVLSLSEDTVNISEDPSEGDLQSFPEELYSPFFNKLSYYPVGGLASQVFSESLTGGCRYPVGCLWTNTVVKGALEDEQILIGDLQSQPQDFEISPFWMEKLPYQLPMAEDGIIWGWQNKGAQLVSMFLSVCITVV